MSDIYAELFLFQTITSIKKKFHTIIWTCPEVDRSYLKVSHLGQWRLRSNGQETSRSKTINRQNEAIHGNGAIYTGTWQWYDYQLYKIMNIHNSPHIWLYFVVYFNSDAYGTAGWQGYLYVYMVHICQWTNKQTNKENAQALELATIEQYTKWLVMKARCLFHYKCVREFWPISRDGKMGAPVG